MNADDSLDLLLKVALPPEDIQSLNEDELEAQLDGFANPPAEAEQVLGPYLTAFESARSGQGLNAPAARTDRRSGPWLTAAAAVVMLAIGVLLVRRSFQAPETELSQADAAQAPRVTIEIPVPRYVGTPGVRTVPPPFERPDATRHSFQAPAGTVLISRGKSLRSSAEPVIGDLRMITDGSWETETGGYVELPPGLQWVQIDLGAARELWGLVVWHFYQDARVYEDVVVQVSVDPAFEREVVSAFNNDADNSSSLGVGRDLPWEESASGRIIELEGTRARYVRLYSAGNSIDPFNHYVEVEVYGR